MSWGYTHEVNEAGFGFFAIRAYNSSRTLVEDNIAFFRNVPTIIQQMTFGDPFGDSVAVLEFPQCSGYDGPFDDPPYNTVPSDTWWLRENVHFDIYWVPCDENISDALVINPHTQKLTMYAHPEDAIPVWEGFSVSVNPTVTGVTMNLQGCLYQLDRYYAKPMFPLRPKRIEQLVARMFDPRRRGINTQKLVVDWNGLTPQSDGFIWKRRYTQDDYTKFKKMDAVSLRFVPSGLDWKKNPPWTTFLTRDTGGWEKTLTGWVQAHLATMYVDPNDLPWDTDFSAITEGDQWTLTKGLWTAGGVMSGRVPLMYVRRQAKNPTLVAWFGQPGVDASINRDGSQIVNVVYGRGTGYDGSAWMVQNFPAMAPWTTWSPIAVDEFNGTPIYHWEDPNWSRKRREEYYDGYDGNWERRNDIWVQERSWNSIPSGIDQATGTKIAEQFISREKNPGYSGTINLQVDLRDPDGNAVSKWMIRPGDVLQLNGWGGSSNVAVRGVNVFHIAQVQLNPQEGTVQLTVDTKFRDLLSIEESIQHNRDTLAPVRMLQVGKQSGLVQDLAMQWNNSQGAGFFPTKAVKMNRQATFPYLDDTRDNPPKNIFKDSFRSDNLDNNVNKVIGGSFNSEDVKTKQPASAEQTDLDKICKEDMIPFYVPVNCGHPNASMRWAFWPVLFSQAGSITRTEFAAYDEDGELAEVEFHVGVYYSANLDVKGMPMITDKADPDYGKNKALWETAFYRVDPQSGIPYAGLNADYHMPNPNYGFKIGWGTYEKPGGYSPGSKDENAQISGMLMDGSAWDFNFTERAEFIAAANKDITAVPAFSYSMGVAVYAQNVGGVPGTGRTSTPYRWCYIMGRFYRQVQIST